MKILAINYLNSRQNFNGRFSEKTLAEIQKNVSSEEFEEIKDYYIPGGDNIEVSIKNVLVGQCSLRNNPPRPDKTYTLKLELNDTADTGYYGLILASGAYSPFDIDLETIKRNLQPKDMPEMISKMYKYINPEKSKQLYREVCEEVGIEPEKPKSKFIVR